jgi:hypothetical protein
LFPDTVEELVVTVGHEEVHADEISDGSEAASGDVALFTLFVNLSSQSIVDCPRYNRVHLSDEWAARREEFVGLAYLVLHLPVAPGWGHILRHVGD